MNKEQAPAPQAEAVRHSFDGYGWQYADAGNGSFWLDRAMNMPDAEPLFTHPAPQAEAAPSRDEALRAAARDVLAWDQGRGFILPYRVRDPLRAALEDRA